MATNAHASKTFVAVCVAVYVAVCVAVCVAVYGQASLDGHVLDEHTFVAVCVAVCVAVIRLTYLIFTHLVSLHQGGQDP